MCVVRLSFFSSREILFLGFLFCDFHFHFQLFLSEPEPQHSTHQNNPAQGCLRLHRPGYRAEPPGVRSPTVTRRCSIVTPRTLRASSPRSRRRWTVVPASQPRTTPKSIKSGDAAIVILVPSKPLCVESFLGVSRLLGYVFRSVSVLFTFIFVFRFLLVPSSVGVI
uniref:Putative elongation factor 1-alpha n=1 Tax=Anopheles aquasalis TaxID=42839 RepID=T1DQQ7_ANOAQ